MTGAVEEVGGEPPAAVTAPPPASGSEVAPERRSLGERLGKLIRALRDGDDSMVETAVLELSQSRRIFAPLAFVVGAFAMLFEGLRLLLHNWRLTLVQLLPAMWIWLAMFDIKVHVLRGRELNVLNGPILIPLISAIALVTAASFFLNAVFAFTISGSGEPLIRPAFERAKRHLRPILAWGLGIGLCLGITATFFARWGKWWFAVSMSLVVAVMMYAYVAVPARLVGINTPTSYSRRDKLSASAIGGALGAVICTPPYALGRIGLLMLGSHVLFIPGIFVVALGVTLQAGATSAIKAIKMSAKLMAGRAPTSASSASPSAGSMPVEATGESGDSARTATPGTLVVTATGGPGATSGAAALPGDGAVESPRPDG